MYEAIVALIRITYSQFVKILDSFGMIVNKFTGFYAIFKPFAKKNPFYLF